MRAYPRAKNKQTTAHTHTPRTTPQNAYTLTPSCSNIICAKHTFLYPDNRNQQNQWRCTLTQRQQQQEDSGSLHDGSYRPTRTKHNKDKDFSKTQRQRLGPCRVGCHTLLNSSQPTRNDPSPDELHALVTLLTMGHAAIKTGVFVIYTPSNGP